MRGQEEWEQDADDVANNWEDELEDKVEQVAKPVTTAKPKSKPKPTVQQVEEEESIFESEADRKRRSEAAVKRADLQNTMDLFGVDGSEVEIDKVLQQEASLLSISSRPGAATSTVGNALFGSLDPHSVPEFEKLADLISSHLSSKFGDRKNYYLFLENIVRKLLINRELSELRTMSSLIQTMISVKQKETKSAPATATSFSSSTSQPTPTVTAAAKKKKPSLLMGAKKSRDLDVTDYGAIDDDDDGY